MVYFFCDSCVILSYQLSCQGNLDLVVMWVYDYSLYTRYFATCAVEDIYPHDNFEDP